MSSRASQKIAVLMGGLSAEREVSLSTGRGCSDALRLAGFDVVEVDAGLDLPQVLADIAPDVVFNALHGRWGEDGVVQGILEWMGLPYTHSGVLASALAMDKERAKAVFRAEGLRVPEGQLASREEVAAGHVLPPPYVVKPVREGSSVGVYLVPVGSNHPPVLDPTLTGPWMVESFVPGRELTVSVMGDRAMTVTEIVTTGWYDYAAKYEAGGSHHVVPADIPADVFDACMEQAVVAHRALGCRGVSRADFRWDDRQGGDGLYVLEVNTQPGMTPTSLTPEQGELCGYDFPSLCRWMVEDASCNR